MRGRTLTFMFFVVTMYILLIIFSFTDYIELFENIMSIKVFLWLRDLARFISSFIGGGVLIRLIYDTQIEYGEKYMRIINFMDNKKRKDK